jgi:cytochrome bd-type quinol oxidase subunit 2
VLCGLGLVAGFGLLGATWLIMKTDGQRCKPRQDRG